MTNKAEVCGWQPKGNSEDIPKPPKFNTDKLSVEKLQEQLNSKGKSLTEIRLFNPYIDITYRTDSFSIERWGNFLENFRKGNEEIISFGPTYEEIHGSDENYKMPEIVTICPRHWAKISVTELEGSGDE